MSSSQVKDTVRKLVEPFFTNGPSEASFAGLVVPSSSFSTGGGSS